MAVIPTLAAEIRSPDFIARLAAAVVSSGVHADASSVAASFASTAAAAVESPENPDRPTLASITASGALGGLLALAEAGLPYDPQSRLTAFYANEVATGSGRAPVCVKAAGWARVLTLAGVIGMTRCAQVREQDRYEAGPLLAAPIHAICFRPDPDRGNDVIAIVVTIDVRGVGVFVRETPVNVDVARSDEALEAATERCFLNSLREVAISDGFKTPAVSALIRIERETTAAVQVISSVPLPVPGADGGEKMPVAVAANDRSQERDVSVGRDGPDPVSRAMEAARSAIQPHSASARIQT